MRLFIAADPTQDVKAQVAAAAKSLLASGADIRPVSEKNVHITLKFLGEVDQETLPSISEHISSVAGHYQPFQAAFGPISKFGSGSSVRTIVCLPVQGAQNLRDICQSLEESLSFIRADGRPPNPHLTLARVKSARNIKPLLSTISSQRPSFDPFTVSEILLYQSTLSPGGPQYSVLEHFALKGAS